MEIDKKRSSSCWSGCAGCAQAHRFLLENWPAVFPEKVDCDRDLPPSHNRGSDGVAGWFIRFVDIPNDVGRYGHMAACRREIRISRILEAKRIETGYDCPTKVCSRYAPIESGRQQRVARVADTHRWIAT